MAASASSCKSKTQMGGRVSDDVESARQEDEKEEERITDEEREEEDQTRSLKEETSAKIHEIFGNDEVVVGRQKKKQKKYRSLKSIYKVTMPVITVEDDKTRIINKILM